MAKAKAQPTLYKIHNTVRRQATRLKRAKSPERHRMNLLLGGGRVRVVRGRHAVVAEALLRQMQPELLAKEEAGMLHVTTMTGQRVDLKTLKPAEPLPASPPKPKPPQDSAANDAAGMQVGQSLPTVEGGKAISEEVKTPEVLSNDIPEGKEEEAEETPADPPADLEQLAQAIYDSDSSKNLAEKAKELGLTPSGNKMAIATMLAEAGYKPGA